MKCLKLRGFCWGETATVSLQFSPGLPFTCHCCEHGGGPGNEQNHVITTNNKRYFKSQRSSNIKFLWMLCGICLKIMFETHNKVALEFVFAFSIVKYQVVDERILANNIYIYDVKISQLIRSGHKGSQSEAKLKETLNFLSAARTLVSQTRVEIMKRSSFDNDMETVSFLWRRKIRL